MIILAIETSCDETAISIISANGGFRNPKFKILSNIVASQIKIHSKWGGVVPHLAKREHERNLPTVLKRALKKAGFQIPKIDLNAVTVGPGLEPALWMGINFAKELAKKWEKALIGINHMEGHILSFLLPQKTEISNFKFLISKLFPAIALLVSGGHTELVLMKDWLKYKIIGQTRDDAAGEAFDKAAKMLGLSYPGGPVVAKLANSYQPSPADNRIKLPRPMLNSKDYDFSFSGLKTAMLYLLKDLKKKGLAVDNGLLKTQLCAEFQQAVIDTLIAKTIRAVKEFKIKTVILGGGVAANKELRKQFRRHKLNFFIPTKNFCTDNAAMIACAAYFRAFKKEFAVPSKLKANGNLKLK